MKTVMILGANIMQVTLARRAKELGYRVVICAANDKGLALKYADKVRYAESDDKAAVLEIAKEEHIDGIVSNAPMYMTTVAYVAEKLGLVGNPVSAIEILEAKIPFRKLQGEMGLYVPQSKTINGFWAFIREALKMTFPIMIKPDMNVSTVGQNKLTTKWQLLKARALFRKARKLSLNGKVLIEEFVVNPERLAVEIEVCVYNGRYLWDGAYACIRSKHLPLLVTSNVFPLQLNEERFRMIKDCVGKIFSKIGIVHGQYNLEGYFTKSGEFFCLEINPRQGGDEMSNCVEYSTGVDLNRLLIETSVGENEYLESLSTFKRKQRYIVRHRVYTDKGGVFRGIDISPELTGRIIDREELEYGKIVKRSANVGAALARYTIEFDSKEELYNAALKLEDLIVPVID